ncbi:DUF4176 domain-containing protein [Gordonibacter sp. An230]|uniref:DUF4176 domain-containing protein n=1 Tax=Gordonibacter sp. An230 TaxID=1965592 RepID=UPI000B3A1CB3|nr:DUF4176 domain-containing protein [Gordonibacter sp. An230]
MIDPDGPHGEKGEREGIRLLPVGSVVAVAGASVPLAVIGRALRDEEGLVWDYLGVPYPEGLVDAEHSLLFSRDRVERVFFEGLRSSRDDALVDAVEAYLEGARDASWPPERASAR